MKPTINRPGKPPGSRTPAVKPGANVTANAGRAASASQAPRVFVAGVVSEMKRVTWPSREEWVTATVLTVGLVIVVGLYTAAADHLFGWLVGLVTGNATR